MSIARDDRYITDAQGRALAGATVWYVLQPANTSSVPPSPLATVYTNISGTVGTNPVVSDGFGHAFAYLQTSVLYTVVINHLLFSTPVVLPDQTVGGAAGGTGLNSFAGIPSGTVNGTNRVFTLTNNGTPLTTQPVQQTVWLNFPLIVNLGYTISGPTITYAVAPQPATGTSAADTIYAQGLF